MRVLGPGLVLFMSILSFACTSEVQQGLDERQANELQSVLLSRGVAAKKVHKSGKKPTWSIEVPEAQAAGAVQLLAELGLPRAHAPTSADLLKSGGLVPSPNEERSRHVLGLVGDLAQTLESIDGVATARVHVALPPPAKPGQPQSSAKASALLKVFPGAEARLRDREAELRALIAGSVEGLDQANVTVVILEIVEGPRVKPTASSPGSPMRAVAIGLALLVSCLSFGIVILALRLRKQRRGALAMAPLEA